LEDIFDVRQVLIIFFIQGLVGMQELKGTTFETFKRREKEK
jgi:hypothetical protein